MPDLVPAQRKVWTLLHGADRPRSGSLLGRRNGGCLQDHNGTPFAWFSAMPPPRELQMILAAPVMLAALQAALPALQDELEAILEIGCPTLPDGLPMRSALDQDLEPVAQQLETAIAAIAAAMVAATPTVEREHAHG